jgi:hypothetical protein
MEQTLLERAQECLDKQIKSATKKLASLETKEEQERYKEVVEANLNAFAEVIQHAKYLENRLLDFEQGNPFENLDLETLFIEKHTKELRTLSKEAARTVTIQRAMQKWPELYGTYEHQNPTQ